MTELKKTDEEGPAWYPVSIGGLERYIGKVISSGQGYNHTTALKKNIAYNLQYIEFQDRVLQDIKISSVIYTQTIKTIILVGSGIVESFLHYLLIINDIHSTTEWEEKDCFKGNQKKMDADTVRVDTIIYKKLPNKIIKHMSFDAMIKCAKSKHIFGTNKVLYNKLDAIRTLRNKVHLQVINSPTDTDWNSFNNSDLSDTCKVLYVILTSSLFSPTTDEKLYFKYLRRNFL